MRYIADAEYGWYAVPRQLLAEFGAEGEISKFSYVGRTGRVAYLEHDVGIARFAAALERVNAVLLVCGGPGDDPRLDEADEGTSTRISTARGSAQRLDVRRGAPGRARSRNPSGNGAGDHRRRRRPDPQRRHGLVDVSATGGRIEESGMTNTSPSTGIRGLARATREWIDQSEDDERTRRADPSPGASRGTRIEASGSAGVATPDPIPPRRFRWGVPGFAVDGPPVLSTRTPADAVLALITMLRTRGVLEPRRRRLLIALYELGDEDKAVPPGELDSVADDSVIARIGAVVALAHRTTPIVPRRGAR